DGGYIIAPPSNPDPTQAKPGYAWVREIPLAAAPIISEGLVGLLRERTDDLAAECAKVRSATPGSRNVVLNTAAFRLAKLVATGRLSETRVREDLTKAAQEVGLELPEIERTLSSA